MKLDRYKLQASLLETAHRNQKLQVYFNTRDEAKSVILNSEKIRIIFQMLQMRPFDLVRSELMTLLHQTFKDYLQPPTLKPLHEIFFFTATATVRRHLAGNKRVDIRIREDTVSRRYRYTEY